jgi:hypothetical protein
LFFDRFNWSIRHLVAIRFDDTRLRVEELMRRREVLQSVLFSANEVLTITGPESGFDGSSDVRLGHAEAVHLVNPANAFNCKR